jgi:uncharacterized protein YoxC
MTTEIRVKRLEERVDQLEADRDGHADKIDQVLHAVVDMHNGMQGQINQLRADLPDIIARAVAPLLVRRED